MSTTDHTGRSGRHWIEVLSDEEAGTLTFVADHDEDSLLAPTEWITVDADVVVDARDYR